MKVIKNIFVVLMLLSFTGKSFATGASASLCSGLFGVHTLEKILHPEHILERGTFVTLPNKQELFVKYHRPKDGKPTLVLLNGLTYDTENWNNFAKYFTDEGYGLVRYDMHGMGETLKREGSIQDLIPWEKQVEDLKFLLETLHIPPPYNIAGLSYGGAISFGFHRTHPELVNTHISMAPFVAPEPKQDGFIKFMIAGTKVNPFTRWNPLINNKTDDELYDYFFKTTILPTYPAVEPDAQKNFPQKLDAIYQLVRGVRKYLPMNLGHLLQGKGKVHLMIGLKDEYIPTEQHLTYWDGISAGNKGSVIRLANTKHKVPEDIPYFASRWVMEILDGNPLVADGVAFDGYPHANIARSLRGEISFR